ncbi:hypothetical protein N8307_02665 [Planktomarina temperata]|nr:hypothetical protein [Planktomarina temperata]
MKSPNQKKPVAKLTSTSTPCGSQLGAAWIASAAPRVQKDFLKELTEDELRALPWMFEFWAMEHQLPPEGDWRTWVVLGADLVAPGRYELSGRLRGQLGSDALMPAQWPVGSYFVLLDGTPEQIELAASGRNTLQYFQIGPAVRPYSDYSYRKLSAAFAGNGLRPYAPVHLAQKWDGADLEFSWIRRARLDGASWDLAEIPLSETQERYQVKIFSGAQLLRLEEVHQAQWRYSAAMQALDGAQGLLELQVAQLSESFGPGLRRKFRFTI